MVTVVCKRCLGKGYYIEITETRCGCYPRSRDHDNQANPNPNCRYCYGSGVIREEKPVSCRVCNGTGIINY